MVIYHLRPWKISYFHASVHFHVIFVLDKEKINVRNRYNQNYRVYCIGRAYTRASIYIYVVYSTHIFVYRRKKPLFFYLMDRHVFNQSSGLSQTKYLCVSNTH